jgi:adenosylmethionine-8-amino-7-oxononanoate aminotransferase
MDQAAQFTLVDKLVLIDAEIKKLEKRKEELKQQVIALGEGTHGGHAGSVSVSLQNRKNLSKDLVAKLITPEQLESCYTTSGSIVVRVTVF